MPEITNSADKKNFFQFLKEEKLYFPVELVEDFLLSLKAKQFLILSGGSGTGKTKLAQAYGRFISGIPDTYRTANIKVKLNKAETNLGFTLKSEDFFNKLPYNGRKANGLYKVRIGDVETECEITLAPRLWYRPNKETIIEEIKKLKENGDEFTEIQVLIPQSSSSEQNYALVPVGSNWTESRFILGFKNALTGKYNSTESLELLLKANNNPTEPFILILDEMNLSHVERYFSEILSAMESEESIVLDSDGTIPGSIDIDNNLFVIGTVNVDETTYAFSPKVLDRANVIEFNFTPIAEYLNNSTAEYDPIGDIEYLQNCTSGLEVRTLNTTELISMMASDGKNTEILSSAISDIDAIQQIMNNMKLSFGFRTINEIMRFLYVSWVYKGKGEFKDCTRFLDSQIKQKILPKIHGNLSIKDDLVKIKNICASKGYCKSAKKLSDMIDILEKQRYVSFNC